MALGLLSGSAMTRVLWILVVLAACDNEQMSPHQVFEVDAAWQVRCPGCSYPARTLSGTIDTFDDPENRAPSCTVIDGFLDVDFGVATVIDPQHTVSGYNLSLSLGYDPATGLDLAKNCQVNVSETDEQLWGKSCSDPTGDCHIEPTLEGDALTFTLRCLTMPSIPFQADHDADLAGPADPQAVITARISPCSL